MREEIRNIVETTPIADTHEHLLEEKDRLTGCEHAPLKDIGILFMQYVDSDLIVAGMTEEDLKLVNDPNVEPERKWELIRPWWEKSRNTGYGMMVRGSIKSLFGEDDLNDETWRRIDEGLRSLTKPGYYRRILKDMCNIDHCQVNALDAPIFRKTDDPQLLLMDLCVTPICSDFDPKVVGEVLGREVKTLNDCIEAIDHAFALYGPMAIAVKNQTAYRRKIDYARWPRPEVEACFKQCAEKVWEASRQERKPLEDYLFHHTVEKAVEYGLPYKMHTGFHAGRGTMSLQDVRHNAGDMCELCRQHPQAKFVFMHITYPYQDEAIAVAKHYHNAYLDMCWSWMINPVAAVRFLKECLLAVPVNKLFMFGGDVSLIELVPGHIQIARQGIIQAVSELVEEGWLQAEDIPEILERLLRGNAYQLFPVKKRMEQK